MGVRLYPVTKDKAVLEKLAGVPAGTVRRYESLGEMYSDRDWEVFQYIVNADESLARWANFIGNGWGKANQVSNKWLTPGGGDLNTPITDPVKVEEILRECGVQLPEGVVVEDLEGVVWF